MQQLQTNVLRIMEEFPKFLHQFITKKYLKMNQELGDFTQDKQTNPGKAGKQPWKWAKIANLVDFAVEMLLLVCDQVTTLGELFITDMTCKRALT